MTSRGSRLDEGLPSYYAGPRPATTIPPVLELYRWKRRQWQEPQDIRDSQRRRLVETISQAYAQVAYYRRLLDRAGIAPKDIDCVEKLCDLPVTERHTLQSTPLQDLIASHAGVQKCIKRCTSGSTSQPLMIYRTGREDDLYFMSWAFAFLESGQRFFDKSAIFHSNPKMYKFSLWFERIGIWRRISISALDEPTEQISLLKRDRPDIIRGNPEDLRSLVSTIQVKKVRGINPRLVFTMGGVLDRHFRLQIESVLGAEVFDFYGSAELGCIGWECTMHKGYHINTDTIVLETVDAHGRRVHAGERGKIVCTGLITHTMPFIRYDTGDIGVLDDRRCPCGRNLPLLSRVEGKANDFFILRDGTKVAPTVIIQFVKRIHGIRQFRIVQEELTLVNAEVVPDSKWTSDSSKTLRNTLELITHNSSSIKIALVDEIARDPSGKFRSIISKVERR